MLPRHRSAAFAVAVMSLAGVAPASAQDHPGRHGTHSAVSVPDGAGYTAADVAFMQAMIAHHAQAIYMSRMAAGRQADPRLIRLAEKIGQSQVAEIAIMQDWLLRNGQAAPDTSSWRTMHMTGMLTSQQLDTLAAATGPAFDDAFLTLMIQHHEGALLMVEELFAIPGAGQDVDVNVFANEVVAVQTAEIGAMHAMLSELSDQ
jgi:uncharacterized protein (DUF305 family)